MKRNLRVIVERGEPTDREDGDLRGLGEIINNNEPVPVLISNEKSGQTEGVIVKYSLIANDEKSHTLIRCRGVDRRYFKNDTVTLFAAAAEMLKKNPRACLYLTHHRILVEKMDQSASSRAMDSDSLVSKVRGLTIDEFCTHHLVQAGILSRAERQVLTSTEADLLIRSCLRAGDEYVHDRDRKKVKG